MSVPRPTGGAGADRTRAPPRRAAYQAGRVPCRQTARELRLQGDPGAQQDAVLDLCPRGEYIARRENVILLGPSGVGNRRRLPQRSSSRSPNSIRRTTPFTGGPVETMAMLCPARSRFRSRGNRRRGEVEFASSGRWTPRARPRIGTYEDDPYERVKPLRARVGRAPWRHSLRGAGRGASAPPAARPPPRPARHPGRPRLLFRTACRCSPRLSNPGVNASSGVLWFACRRILKSSPSAMQSLHMAFGAARSIKPLTSSKAVICRSPPFPYRRPTHRPCSPPTSPEMPARTTTRVTTASRTTTS